MTPEKREEITRLASDMHDKKLRYEMLSMRNVANLTAEESKQATIDYQLARAEYLEARSLLDAAMPESMAITNAANQDAAKPWQQPYLG